MNAYRCQNLSNLFIGSKPSVRNSLVLIETLRDVMFLTPADARAFAADIVAAADKIEGEQT